MPKTHLILASQSRYRAAQLRQLGYDFEQRSPECDEDAYKAQGLAPQALAETLSVKKAESVFRLFPQATIIGGDQLVHFNGEVLGKSHTKEKAAHDLKRMSGMSHELISSFCVMSPLGSETYTNIAVLKMRNLTPGEIEWYIEQDQPMDCAGSYKLESYGIGLFEKIECDDFSSITGLPLLALNRVLIKFGHPRPELK